MADIFEIKIPHSGAAQNAEVVEWNVEVGDVVEAGQVLADVSTEKVDVELEAPRAGKIAKLLLEEGEEVPLGTTAILLVEADVALDSIGEEIDAFEPTEPGGAV